MRGNLHSFVRTLLIGTSLFATFAYENPGQSGVFCRRVKVCNRWCLPNYPYGDDDLVTFAKLVTKDSDVVEEQVILVLETPQVQRLPSRDAVNTAVAKPAAESILTRTASTSPIAAPATPANPLDLPGPLTTQIPVMPGAGVARSTIVRRRRFSLPAPQINLANVSLSQVGLAIYETGQIACTGNVVHSGGPGGTVAGNRVTVTVRGYGANPLAAPSPPTGPVLFETSQSLWINRGEEATISLSSHEICERVRRHFDEVRNLEIKLSYRNDR